MIARSACRNADSGACGTSASGLASASTRKRWAAASSGNEPASQLAHTTPPALAEKAPRCSRSPQEAQLASSGMKPAASRSLSLKASACARLAAAGCSSSRVSSLQSRL